jgi:hypothetical protein
MKVLGWVMVYEGLRVYDSREHSWDDLPEDGVLDGCVYREGEDGRVTRRTVGGADRYWLLPDGLTVVHSNDPEEEIRARYPGAQVKRGKWVPDDEMARAAALTLEYEWR